MDEFLKSNADLFLIILSWSLIAACNVDSPDSVNEAGSSSCALEDVCPAVGSLFYVTPQFLYAEYDLATQSERILLPVDGVKSISISDDQAFYSMLLSSGSKFGVFDSDLNLYMGAQTNGSFKGPIRISPDNQKVMYHRQYATNSDLGILDSNSDLIRKISEVAGHRAVDLYSWDWLSNDSIIFSINDSIYKLVDIENGTPEYITAFTGYDIGNITVSPDGMRIVFTKSMPGAKQQAGGVFLLDIDGNREVQLTTLASRMRATAWSPDSQYVAAVRGDSGINPDPIPDACPDIYVIPVSGAQVADIVAEDSSPAIKIQKREEDQIEDLCFSDSFALDWR